MQRAAPGWDHGLFLILRGIFFFPEQTGPIQSSPMGQLTKLNTKVGSFVKSTGGMAACAVKQRNGALAGPPPGTEGYVPDTGLSFLFPLNLLDDNGRRQGLAIVCGHLDLLDDIHSADNLAKGGESLAIRITLAAKIQFRLVTYTEKKARSGGVGAAAGHGNSAVRVFQAGFVGTFQRDRVMPALWWIALVSELGIHGTLDDFDLDVIIGLVLHGHGPVKHTAVVLALVHIPQKIRHGYRRVAFVQYHLDLSQGSSHHHGMRHVVGLGRGEQTTGNIEKGEKPRDDDSV